MRNKRFLAGTIVTSAMLLASALVFPMAQAQLANPGYVDILDSRVIGDPNAKSVTYEVETNAKIPKKADQFINEKLCFGYAWIGDPNLFSGIGDPNIRPGVISTMGKIPSALGAACGIGNPDQKKTWDTQTVTLSRKDGPVCVVSISDPDERNRIREGTLDTSLDVGNAAILPSTFELAASFELQADAEACRTDSTTGLKMVPISIGDPHV